MFNTICDIFSDREKQLEIQEKQDNIILENFNKCPLTMFKLVMLERKMNRDQLKSNNTKNLFTIINNTKDNIEKIDTYQEELQKVLMKKNNLCFDLQEFIKRYE